MRGLILRDCAQEGPERRRIEGYIPVGVLKSTASRGSLSALEGTDVNHLSTA